MASLNSLDVTGRLTRDPELKAVGQNKVCDLGVAVDTFGDKPTLFLSVSVWGKQAESCAQFLAKGREVAIHGRIDEVRGYAKRDGSVGVSLEVTAQDVAFIGGRPEGGSQGGQGGSRRSEPVADVGWDDAPASGRTNDDDDIPF